VRNLFIQFTLTSNSVVERTLLCGTPASWSKKSEIIYLKFKNQNYVCTRWSVVDLRLQKPLRTVLMMSFLSRYQFKCWFKEWLTRGKKLSLYVSLSFKINAINWITQHNDSSSNCPTTIQNTEKRNSQFITLKLVHNKFKTCMYNCIAYVLVNTKYINSTYLYS